MKERLFWGRILWVLLAINSLVVFGLTVFVTWQMLQTPSARIREGLAEQGLSPGVYSGFFFGSITIVFVVYFVVAALIFVLRPHDGFALFVSIFLMNYGAANASPQFVEFVQFYLHPPLWFAIPTTIASLFSWPLLVTFLAVFPDGQFVPRWVRWVCLFGAVLTTAWTLFPSQFGDGSNAIGLLGAACVIFLSGATLYAQIWRYRHHSDAVQRQQTKWFLYAVAIFFAVTVASFLPPLVVPASAPGLSQSVGGDMASMLDTVAFIVLPIAVGIAILRYRLWDIDLLIRRTATYSLVTATLLVIYITSIIVLQQIFSGLTGQTDSGIVTVLSTLGIAALFVPVRNRIQGAIDRRFNRKRYDAQKVLEQFAQTVRDETDLERLSNELVTVVNETMQPRSVSLWMRGAGKHGDR